MKRYPPSRGISVGSRVVRVRDETAVGTVSEEKTLVGSEFSCRKRVRVSFDGSLGKSSEWLYVDELREV